MAGADEGPGPADGYIPAGGEHVGVGPWMSYRLHQ